MPADEARHVGRCEEGREKPGHAESSPEGVGGSGIGERVQGPKSQNEECPDKAHQAVHLHLETGLLGEPVGSGTKSRKKVEKDLGHR